MGVLVVLIVLISMEYRTSSALAFLRTRDISTIGTISTTWGTRVLIGVQRVHGRPRAVRASSPKINTTPDFSLLSVIRSSLLTRFHSGLLIGFTLILRNRSFS